MWILSVCMFCVKCNHEMSSDFHPTKDFNAFGSMPESPPGFWTPAAPNMKGNIKDCEWFLVLDWSPMENIYLLIPMPAPPVSNVTHCTHHQMPGRGWIWNSLNFGIERKWSLWSKCGLKMTKSPFDWRHLHWIFTKLFITHSIKSQKQNVLTRMYNRRFERLQWMVNHIVPLELQNLVCCGHSHLDLHDVVHVHIILHLHS